MGAADSVVFFDFDGTLVNTIEHYFFHYNEYARQNNKPVISSAKYQELRKNSLEEVRKKLGINLLKAIFLNKKLTQAVYQDVSAIRFVPGIIDIINEIHCKKIPVFIISSNSRDNIQQVLIANKIKHIEKIIPTFRGFNKTYFLKKHLKRKAYQHAFLVSDEYSDIEVANNLGVISMAVKWGANDFDEKNNITPNYIINDPKDIISAINQYIA